MPAQLNCGFVTGLAGSGKSTGLKVKLELDPSAYALTSTTGLSAINMGVATLNSTLRYFDTDSLQESYNQGKLYHIVRRLVTGPNAVRGIAIDEASMLDSRQLDIVYDVMMKVVRHEDVTGDLELTLVGDMAQLAPVKAKFCFEAKCWPVFDANTLKLDKVYRQDNMIFLEALNEFRAGKGRNGIELLKKCGVEFHPKLTRFKGTTIVPKNDSVDNFNKVLFNELKGELIRVSSIKTGIQSSDWGKIPNILELKIGALVMILANDTQYKTYANGDQGLVEGFDKQTEMFQVRLVSGNKERNNKLVCVGRVKREVKDNVRDIYTGQLTGVRDIVGTIEFMPLRLAYASTIHKSQGLSLDNVQIDFRDRFFGNPGMIYVALSRCRTPEGLRLVGEEQMLINRTVLNPKVERFL